ncbi:MAG: dimethylsulfonioproprionate lyase family protein [Motiliproteus sp.]
MDQIDLSSALLQLWEEIAETATEGNDQLQLLIHALHHIDTAEPGLPSCTEAVDRLLQRLGAMDSSSVSLEPFKMALKNAGPLLHWYPNSVYENASAAQDLENYCCNLVGLTSDTQPNPFLLHSEEVMIGLFLLGPNRLYPAHQHPAVEMYTVLAGTAQWQREGEPWQTRKPGEYFIHTSNQAHAMRTLDEPLLALWAWTGDLGQWAIWSENTSTSQVLISECGL